MSLCVQRFPLPSTCETTKMQRAEQCASERAPDESKQRTNQTSSELACTTLSSPQHLHHDRDRRPPLRADPLGPLHTRVHTLALQRAHQSDSERAPDESKLHADPPNSELVSATLSSPDAERAPDDSKQPADQRPSSTLSAGAPPPTIDYAAIPTNHTGGPSEYTCSPVSNENTSPVSFGESPVDYADLHYHPATDDEDQHHGETNSVDLHHIDERDDEAAPSPRASTANDQRNEDQPPSGITIKGPDGTHSWAPNSMDLSDTHSCMPRPKLLEETRPISSVSIPHTLSMNRAPFPPDVHDLHALKTTEARPEDILHVSSVSISHTLSTKDAQASPLNMHLQLKRRDYDTSQESDVISSHIDSKLPCVDHQHYDVVLPSATGGTDTMSAQRHTRAQPRLL